MAARGVPSEPDPYRKLIDAIRDATTRIDELEARLRKRREEARANRRDEDAPPVEEMPLESFLYTLDGKQIKL